MRRPALWKQIQDAKAPVISQQRSKSRPAKSSKFQSKKYAGKSRSNSQPRQKALWTTLPTAESAAEKSDGKEQKRFTSLRSKPKAVSKEKSLSNKIYEQAKREWRKNPVNRICRKCGGEAMKSPHHYRGRLGALLYWIPGFVALCFECHRFVHDNPTESRKQGLLALPGEWNKMPI